MSGGKIAMIVLITVVAVLIISVVACMAVINHYLNMIPKVDKDKADYTIPRESEEFDTDGSWDYIPDDPDDPNGTNNPDVTEPPEVHPGDVTWPEDPPTPPANDGLLNIMLVGTDARPNQKTRQRSDTMILISINESKKTAAMISFLRDTYVQIPGYSDNRLNVAYRYGDFPLMKKTFTKNFGITIDGFFDCNFTNFVDIIDYLGGVEIDITEKESKHLGNVPAGKVNLTGEQALAYSRIRKIDNDTKRTQRQQKVLMSLFNKFKGASIGQLNEIANAILPRLRTDLTNSEIMNLLTNLLPMIGDFSNGSIKTYTVPYAGSYKGAKIRGMYVDVPDLPAIRKKLQDEMLPY